MVNRFCFLLIFFMVFYGVGWCGCSAQAENAPPKKSLKLEMVASYPHDPRSFTQGLAYENGELFESSGKYGESSLRRVELKTGKVLQKISQNERFFSEGITIVGDKIYQLTWQEHSCFLYDKSNFKWEKTFKYPGEGWGITWDGKQLIVSDGSAVLKFYDPENFKLQGSLRVQDGKEPIVLLNELEYINGEIWANVLYSDFIVRIDPKTGQVVGRIDCRGLVPPEIKAKQNREEVLNGIAFDEENQRVFITGKYWPVLYELKIINGEKSQKEVY